MARLRFRDTTAKQRLEMGFALLVLGIVIPPILVVGGLLLCGLYDYVVSLV
jgi:hypothetical protein